MVRLEVQQLQRVCMLANMSLDKAQKEVAQVMKDNSGLPATSNEGGQDLMANKVAQLVQRGVTEELNKQAKDRLIAEITLVDHLLSLQILSQYHSLNHVKLRELVINVDTADHLNTREMKTLFDARIPHFLRRHVELFLGTWVDLGCELESLEGPLCSEEETIDMAKHMHAMIMEQQKETGLGKTNVSTGEQKIAESAPKQPVDKSMEALRQQLIQQQQQQQQDSRTNNSSSISSRVWGYHLGRWGVPWVRRTKAYFNSRRG